MSRFRFHNIWIQFNLLFGKTLINFFPLSSIVSNDTYYRSSLKFFIILLRLIPFPNTGLKISPSLLIRCIALKIVKSVVLSPFLISSQYKGIDTGAPGLGLTEYGDATVACGLF